MATDITTGARTVHRSWRAAYRATEGGTMHTKPMADSEGTFGDWRPTAAENPDYRCRGCGSDDVWYREWDSSDGAYTDHKYECRACKRTWWVEGSDA